MFKRVAAAFVAISLVTASAAMADSRRDHHGRRDNWDHHGERYDRDQHHNRFRPRPYRQPAGYRDHHWRRGEHLPVAYYAPPHIVHDYHVHHLHRPPHGYHWVRVDRDAVLAAIASGVVLDVIYNRF